jgi:hypothetical protein
MKSFRKYLAESVRTYRYKIRIAGETPKQFIELFKHNLNKFDPVKIGDAKTTPIQSQPHGFPELKDQSVTIFDVEFKYPATEPMIKQLAQLLGYDENLVRMSQSDYMDSAEKEAEMYANQPSPLIGNDSLEDNGKEASKEYGDSYLSRIRAQEQGREIKQEFAAKKTADEFSPFDTKKQQSTMNTKSPMSSVKRPSLPATGARK